MRFLFLALATLCCLRPGVSQAGPSPEKREKVLFIGSSTVWFWRDSMKEDFPHVQAVNLGEGGTDFGFLMKQAPAWAKAYPDANQVVIYSGDNDLASGRQPGEVARTFHQLAEILHAEFPGAELHVISIKPSPDRFDKIYLYQQANDLIEANAKQLGYISFIDTHTPMLGPDGYPQRELFREDRLHMAGSGYELWREMVGPSLSGCEEIGTAGARFSANTGRIYKLSSGKRQLSQLAEKTKNLITKVTGEAEKGCHAKAEVALAFRNASVALKAENEGALENGSALVITAIGRALVARAALHASYRKAAAETKRFGAWLSSQALNLKAPAGESAQLRREAVGGRRLVSQASRKILSADHELEEEVRKLEDLGKQLLERWEGTLADSSSPRFKAAREEIERLRSERIRLDEAAIEAGKR